MLLPSDGQPTTTNTTCPYCGVGCGVVATAGETPAITGDKAHPANQGRLCVKGASLAETLGDHGRLLAPRVNGSELPWPQALEAVAASIKAAVDRHG
ncbi:MAG: nitrate reductase, partial [Marinobacter sp.]|nr:nitrate reductase [Marinobacter sp.]